MSTATTRPGDEDREDERHDEMMEARYEARRRHQTCVCDTDGTMPGHCPGPDNCPYSGSDEQEQEEETMIEETKAPALAERIPSAGEVEAALTAWYPGEWPHDMGSTDEGILANLRGEMSETIRAAEAVRLAEAGTAK